ncbi:MAG: hypothetical protein R3301_03875 [Saprospiraceae bacterium]|nr:hypothetical protein [Saprospiraceae bacterium]
MLALGPLMVSSACHEPQFKDIREEVADTVGLMRNTYVAEEPRTRRANQERMHAQWVRQNWLAEHATNDELWQLRTSPAASVKVIAVMELMRRDTSRHFVLLEDVLQPGGKHDLLVTDGHSGYRFHVGVYLFDYIYCLNPAITCQSPSPADLNLDEKERVHLLELRKQIVVDDQ